MDFRPGNTTLGFQASQSHKVTTLLFLSEKVFFSVALSKDPVAELTQGFSRNKNID